MERAPDAVDAYFAAMEAHDWAALRSCLADDFTREGPYEEHRFPDPDGYVAFLADLLPTLRDHSVTVTRSVRAGDVAVVDATESLTLDGEGRTVRVCAVFDLDAAGRIARVEVFARRLPPPG